MVLVARGTTTTFRCTRWVALSLYKFVRRPAFLPLVFAILPPQGAALCCFLLYLSCGWGRPLTSRRCSQRNGNIPSAVFHRLGNTPWLCYLVNPSCRPCFLGQLAKDWSNWCEDAKWACSHPIFTGGHSMLKSAHLELSLYLNNQWPSEEVKKLKLWAEQLFPEKQLLKFLQSLL